MNVVILPYKVTASTNRPLSDAAKRLTLLLESDVLFSILKYGSVGAIRLVQREGQEQECTPEIVLAKLLGDRPGAMERVRAGHGLVLVWGRIYEEGDSLYLQSYMRFLRRGLTDDFTLSIKDRPFVGRLPADAVAFAPQRLTLSDLNAIRRDFDTYAMVRQRPDPAAPGEPMPLELSGNRPFSYYVVSTQGEWMQIRSEGGGPSGWIRAGTGQDWPSMQKMGKLYLVEAIVGYLQYRIARGSGGSGSPQRVEWVLRALDRFESAGQQQPPVARALGEALRGYFAWFGPEPSTVGTENALAHLREAVALVPYSADSRNLETLAALHLAYAGRRPGSRLSEIEKSILQAASLEPDNPRVLANLESFYKLASSAGPPPEAAAEPRFSEDLDERLVAAQAAREKRPVMEVRERRAISPSVEVAITDRSGAGIRGAQVTVTDEAGKTFSGTSDETGRFRISLPAGLYKVRANSSGYVATERQLSVGKEATEMAIVVLTAGG